jgi:hypothetical protein
MIRSPALFAQSGFRLSQPFQACWFLNRFQELLSWKAQFETPNTQGRKYKSIRIIATCKLTLDQLARFLAHQDHAAETLENQDAWGTGKDDLVLRGKSQALITKDGPCAKLN